MTIKLAILKSGESIITDIKEGIVDDKVVAYIFNSPCTVSVNGTYKILDDNEDTAEKLSLKLQPWPYLSVDKVVTVVLDWVITIVEPNPELKEMYEKEVLKNGTTEHQTTDTAQ
jgi:hypothetical protein